MKIVCIFVIALLICPAFASNDLNDQQKIVFAHVILPANFDTDYVDEKEGRSREGKPLLNDVEIDIEITPGTPFDKNRFEAIRLANSIVSEDKTILYGYFLKRDKDFCSRLPDGYFVLFQNHNFRQRLRNNWNYYSGCFSRYRNEEVGYFYPRVVSEFNVYGNSLLFSYAESFYQLKDHKISKSDFEYVCGLYIGFKLLLTQSDISRAVFAQILSQVEQNSNNIERSSRFDSYLMSLFDVCLFNPGNKDFQNILILMN